MKRRRVSAVLMAVLLLPPASAFAASVYVKSLKARLLQSPKFDAQLVAEVDRGQELSLKEKADRWLKVTFTGKDGWVSELLVSDEPPKDRTSVLSNGAEDLSGKSRRRASAIATAGASRGLTKEGMAALQAEDGRADYKALAKVEGLALNPDEALSYLLGGFKGGAR